MLKGIKHILFTSNLSDISRHSFNIAAMLAMQFKCKITLLHVIEDLPRSVENRLQGLFGEGQWETILKGRVQTAQDLLVGKLSKTEMIRAALNQFCNEAGISSDECGYVDHDIVIVEGDVISRILDYATEQSCDIIIMGASEGFVSKSSIGKKIKSVMKKAKVPVMVVPNAD